MGNGAYRFGVGIAITTAFLTIWVNLAVGMIGSEDNRYNLVFVGVLGLALVGALVARFKPRGMALAMVVAAVSQAAGGAAGLASDARGGVFSMAFAALWLLSAALFQKSAREAGSASA